MLYRLFINVMNFLNNNFGYAWAIRIKLFLLVFACVGVTSVVSLLMSSDFFLNVDKNPLLSSKATIIGPTEINPNFSSNPKNFKMAVEVNIRYFLIRIFHKKDIAYENLKLILRMYALLLFLLMFFAILLSWWVYLPPTLIVK